MDGADRVATLTDQPAVDTLPKRLSRAVRIRVASAPQAIQPSRSERGRHSYRCFGWSVEAHIDDATHEIVLAARSAYLMTQTARSAYDHHIPSVAALRYSITFRTLR